MSPGRQPPRRAPYARGERPTHPRYQAIALCAAVMLAIIVLALISTFGTH